MYTAFYGLREKPFSLSPDPRYLYLAGSHREALAHLLYGIEQGEGFISITGEVGTGKTTLCRTLLERLDGDADGLGQHTELAFLFNPSRTALELLQSICAEFDLPAEGLTRRSLMAQLDNFLVEQKQLGRRVLLIIDEAQTLSDKTLEQVRLLSNLETSREKLIQILLLGQPELDRKLDSRGLRQLRQRISVRWRLEPLSAEETRAYVRHRISIAAGESKELFSESALREVHRRTKGIPRLINQLCDRALLAGYAAGKSQIRPALIRAAAKEIPDARRPGGGELGRRGSMRPWMAASASLGVVAIATYAGLQVGRHGFTNATEALFSAEVSRTQQVENALPTVGANVDARLRSSVEAPDASSIRNARSRLARPLGYVTSDASLRPENGDREDNALVDLGATGRDSEFASAALALPIPAPPEPEVTALAPGLLRTLLANRDGQLAMAESQRTVLEEFGRRVPALATTPTDSAALRSSIEDRGLTATSFDGGSIDLLRRLNHPVLLPVSARPANEGATGTGGDVKSPWLAIVGFSGDRARLAGLISGRIVTVPEGELEKHWLETGIIVWERYEPVAEMLVAGQAGNGVQWLQRSLAELRFYRGSADGLFNDQTSKALVAFQQEQGLVADGIAGPLTQIALYGRLTRYPVPRLSSADIVPSLPPVSAPPTSPAPEALETQTRSRPDSRPGERG